MLYNKVRDHYEHHPYPRYPLLSSVRRCDTYALNLQALWARFNGEFPETGNERILIAGSGSFAPYPFGLANPQAQVTALDLSCANLKRARLHCLLHGLSNVRFVGGDLLDSAMVPGPFHLIDSFGVLHHLGNPLAGLLALERRLVPGGILRLMIYGRYARREAESVRHAIKLLGITELKGLKKLIAKAKQGSRLRDFLEASWEARSDSGLADLFLHPSVRTYRIDEFLELVDKTRLQPLLFAHSGALADPAVEIERLRDLDRRRETPTNIICYLGLDTAGPVPFDGRTLLRLNPSLLRTVAFPCFRPVRVAGRLGIDNPILDRAERLFLRRFRAPKAAETLSVEETQRVQPCLDALFLLAYKQNP